jgi:hypothetical protein
MVRVFVSSSLETKQAFTILPHHKIMFEYHTFHEFDRISTHYNEQLHSSVTTSTNMNELPDNDISQNNTERGSPKFSLAEIMIIS